MPWGSLGFHAKAVQRTQYTAESLIFAYSIHCYLRWNTYRRKPVSELKLLDKEGIVELLYPYGIHLLEFSSDERNCLALVSLKPTDTVSAAASKVKGRFSSFLRSYYNLAENVRLFARGYFASTSGKSTELQVINYLSKQSGHHGFEKRTIPPVFQREFAEEAVDESRLNPNHALACLRYHVVLATTDRKGIFGSESGPVFTSCWQKAGHENGFKLIEVSFLPDHVHLAIRSHPTVAPAEIVSELMNLAEEVIWERYSEHVIQAGVDRLFTPSAYVGGYGRLNSKAIRGYLDRWKRLSQGT